MIQNSFLEKGKEKELEFALALCKAKSLSSSIIEEASKEDDIYRHIDIWVGANSFDVKAAKKTNRSDLLPNYDIHWIELRNVHGDKGWLFGQADYIAFELETTWCSCPRISLIRSLKGKIDFSNFTTNRDDMFRVYRRKDRLDAIVKVDSDFLTKVTSSFLIPKE